METQNDIVFYAQYIDKKCKFAGSIALLIPMISKSIKYKEGETGLFTYKSQTSTKAIISYYEIKSNQMKKLPLIGKSFFALSSIDFIYLLNMMSDMTDFELIRDPQMVEHFHPIHSVTPYFHVMEPEIFAIYVEIYVTEIFFTPEDIRYENTLQLFNSETTAFRNWVTLIFDRANPFVDSYFSDLLDASILRRFNDIISETYDSMNTKGTKITEYVTHKFHSEEDVYLWNENFTLWNIKSNDEKLNYICMLRMMLLKGKINEYYTDPTNKDQINSMNICKYFFQWTLFFNKESSFAKRIWDCKDYKDQLLDCVDVPVKKQSIMKRKNYNDIITYLKKEQVYGFDANEAYLIKIVTFENSLVTAFNEIGPYRHINAVNKLRIYRENKEKEKEKHEENTTTRTQNGVLYTKKKFKHVKYSSYLEYNI